MPRQYSRSLRGYVGHATTHTHTSGVSDALGNVGMQVTQLVTSQATSKDVVEACLTQCIVDKNSETDEMHWQSPLLILPLAELRPRE